ncbi:hypothetical protein C5Y96_12775 [Blastopirellula marina]|uniref:Uncharacterized protein n=1 Tax=Blastopirellula marina TaxID=124 RepID=A0A2S8FH39_9BACT|nr:MULTISPECIES: hypothetical protein [Pirellulaceae]PQO31214.1 hypothetical protein C5Y96_12775 [Blastopirellula marina]RCS51608.1 hypothetical protein DTL36_12785 [Bremerella cremea]
MNYRLLVRIPTALIVLTKMLFVVCIVVQAAGPASESPEIEAARLRIKLYQGQEYPLERRLLNSKINVAKARIDSLKRQQAEYEQFTKFKYSAPLFGQIEHVKVGLVEAEENLKNLIEEKSLLERFHQDRMRLLELELKMLQRIGL